MKKRIVKKGTNTKPSRQRSLDTDQDTTSVHDVNNSDFIQLKSLQSSADQHQQVTVLESLQNQADAFKDTSHFENKTVQRQNLGAINKQEWHKEAPTKVSLLESESSQKVNENANPTLIQAQEKDTVGTKTEKPLQMMPFAQTASGLENKNGALSINYKTIPGSLGTSTVPETNNTDAVFQLSIKDNAASAAKTVGKGGKKFVEYAFDGLAHPLVALYGAGKRAKQAGSIKEGMKEAVIGGADNPLKRGISYPYTDAYGDVLGRALHLSQSLSATSGEVMKWSGSMAATGGIVLLAMPANPVAASFVTSSTAVTSLALLTKTASSGLHGAVASAAADHLYNFIDENPEDNAIHDNLSKYFLRLADARYQNHQYGASLMQSAMMIGGGIATENIGGSTDQLANFKETVGLSDAGTDTAEAIAGLSIGTVANSQDDVENQLNLRKNIKDLKDGDDFKTFNTPGVDLENNSKLVGDFNNFTSLSSNTSDILKARWNKIKEDSRFKPPKNKDIKKSKALILNPLYMLWRALNGIVGMAELLYNTFKSDAYKVEKDEFHRPVVTKEKSGKEGYGRKAGKAAATGIGGLISGGIGGAVGAVGGLFRGMYRGAKEGAHKGANTYETRGQKNSFKLFSKHAGNFMLGGLGGLVGGLGGAVSGAGAGMAGGAYAGAMNVKDSVYGQDASAKNFASNTLLGGVSGGVAASAAVGKANKIDEFKSKIDSDRDVEGFLSNCLATVRSMRDRIGASRDAINNLQPPP